MGEPHPKMMAIDETVVDHQYIPKSAPGGSKPGPQRCFRFDGIGTEAPFALPPPPNGGRGKGEGGSPIPMPSNRKQRWGPGFDLPGADFGMY